MNAFRLMLAMLVVALLTLAPAQAQNFPKLTGRVVDAANLLDPAQESQLTALSADIEKASGRQFVVATIPDLQGYPIEDYGYQLGRAWKIGQADANNGILLIVAPNEKKVRIEVGYGLEPIMTDALAGIIIRDAILPKFRAGDMAGGIMDGAAQIGEQMKLPLEAAEAKAKARIDAEAPRASSRRSNGNGDPVGPLFVIFWVIVIGFIAVNSVFGGGRRGRRYRGGVAPVILWSLLDAAARSGRGGGSSWSGGGGGGWSSGGGGGGFSGGGGSFGGGGASGSW